MYARWTAGTDRSTSVPYSITHSTGSNTVLVNQQANNNAWVLLGNFTFNAGVSAISVGSSNTGITIADAIQVIPATTTTTGIYYAYADHLNTVRVLTRPADNKMVWRWDNTDPFGLTPPDQNPASLGSFIYNPRFPGQVYDKETNHHYNYFRDYDPQLGRYVESDPIGLNAGPNTYLYANANPLMYTDPLGLFGWADMPTLPQEVVNFSAGLGDALLWGFGDDLRDMLDIGGVDKCSGEYGAGSWTGIGASGARGVYAGAVKLGSVYAASGVAASNIRSGIKTAFRGGLGKNWRKPDLSKYKTDAALRKAAGRSNPYVNGYAAGVGAGGATGVCGCDK
ncbi:hypothetical protein BH11PSE12_BH11PSE12_06230 [soil metagenome]